MRNIIYAFKKILNNKTGKIGENWKFDAGSPLNSGPVVSDIDGDGNFEIITGTTDGKLIALDKAGNLKWSYAINEKVDDLELMFLDNSTINSIGNTPHTDDVQGSGETSILFGTELGYVYLLNFKGELIWKFKATGAVRGSILCHDFGDKSKRVIFGSLDSYLYCISNKGELIWKVNAGSEVEGSPGVIDNKIIVGTNSGEIMCFDKDGQLLWKFDTDAKVSAQPVEINISNSKKMVIGSTDGTLYCIDLAGNIFWKFKTGGAIYSKATIYDLAHNGKPEVLVGSCDNFVYCLNQNGKKIWSFETDFWIVSSPIVFDLDGDGKEEIIIGSYDHNIYILDSQGSYIMDYVPGISGTVNQAGSYSDVMTQSPGKLAGKKLWQFNVEGVIVGCTVLGPNIVINTKKGHIKSLKHLKE